MAFANKYLFKFNSVHGVEYNIYISKEGYSGSVIQRSLGRPPVLRKKKNGPICGTSLELYAECTVDGEFAELYTSNPKEYKVDVYRSSVLIWTGFVSTELYSEPSIAPPYDIEIVATDGLGELKLNRFIAPGEVRLSRLLYSLLSYTGLNRDIYMAANLIGDDMTWIDTLAWRINIDFLANETAYDVLSKVLESLHATITTYKGDWLIIRESDIDTLLSDGDLSVVKFANNLITDDVLNNVIEEVGRMGVCDMWPVGNLSTAIEPARKRVTVEAPWHLVGYLEDPTMEDSTSEHWSTTGDTFFHQSRGYWVGNNSRWGSLSQDVPLSYLTTRLKLTVHAMPSNTTGRGSTGELKIYAKYTVGGTTNYGTEHGWKRSDEDVTTIGLGKLTIGGSDGLTEEYSIEIPALNATAAGTLQIVIEGKNAFVSYAMLDFVMEKGYKDTVSINNGARGDENSVEILGGRVPEEGLQNIKFYQGVWKSDSDTVIIEFADSHHAGADFLSLSTLDRALSVALPRLRTEGAINVPSGLNSIPILIQTSVTSLIETFDWDLLNEEVKVSALSLPAASITVESETITPMEDESGSSSSHSGGGSGGGSSSGHAYYADEAEHAMTADDADHADTADEALHAADADHADTADEALHAADADHADEADHALDSDKWNGKEFGNYLNQPVRTTDEVAFAKVTTPRIQSANFSEGPLGAGFRLWLAQNGANAELELDSLTVRKTMKIFELIIQQIKHQGGMVIYSAASIVCSRVEELENGYKCYFDTMENEQGDAQVPNEFVVGDQARCQRFDLASTSAKYYWRLVTAVGDDYIVLSKTDCDSGSGVPAVGDNIVQLGNRTNTARQSAKVTTCIDSQSPRDDYYKGINSYDLTGKLITTVGVKDNKVGVWTKDGNFEGIVTISGGSGLENLDEWASVSQSITNAQAAANKALAAIADINSDSVLDPSEKNTIRTEWITINGVEALDRVGARGSYSITKALYEKYQDISGQIRLDYNGHVYTRAGIVYTYSAFGVAALDAAYQALREYLVQVQLNNRSESYDGFDRARYSDLLTTYYDAEIEVNDKINQAIQKQIKDTKAELLADLGSFETAVEQSLQEMQGIIDNTIETWFFDGVPTLNNLPASAWTTDELLARHLGDLYYNNTTGIAYRFQRSGEEGNYTYYWYTIPDSAVAEALAAAARAQDTADHKRRVFRSQPTNSDAYDPGDIWLHATYGNDYNDEMLVCTTAKAAGVAFSIAHWGTATKYTDDTVANQARAEAAAAQRTADQAVLDAAAAQQAADNAQTDATAANNRLNNWANDGKISPTEKSALKQQQKDVQTEYTEICAEATRYGVSTTAYASAYTAANTALSKYSASSPENITIESDYANISSYYDARNTILQAIAAAAKKVADDAQDAADAAQDAADAAQGDADRALEAIADINSDSVLDPSEKAAVKSTWVGINGNESLDVIGDNGTYAAAKKMILELKDTGMTTKLVYGGSKVYTFNGYALTYGNYGEAQLDAAYNNLREFLRHCELHVEGPFYGFSRSEYAARLRDYDTAIVNVQKLYTDMAKQAAADTSMDAIARNLGYTSFAEMEAAARAGETIVEGGYIRTDLINVATLIAKRLSTTDENSLKSLTIQDNQIKLYDSNGALRTHIHANALSTPATNTQEIFSPGLVNFTGLGMVDEFIRASATLFNFVASSGSDTIRGSALLSITFNLRLELSQRSFADFDVDVAAKLKINGTTWQSNSLGFSVIGEGSHVLIQQTIHLDPTTARALSSAGAKDVSIEVEVEPQHGLAIITNSVYGSISVSAADYTVTHVSATPQITEVGTNGIQVVRSGSEYAQLHDNNGSLEFKIITGSYGLRVNSSGVQKTTNGGSTWVNI